MVAVDDVSFDLNRSEWLAITGPSGSGKSTLARIIVRLLEPTKGEVKLHGTNVFEMDPDTVRATLRRKVRLIFQHPDAALNPARTVRQTLTKSLKMYADTSGGDMEAALARLLDTVALAKGHLDRFPDELSGGEKRRVSIAAALAAGPELLIGDEMFSGLDALTQEQIFRLLQRQREDRGLTLVLLTHQPAVVRSCDRVLQMRNGRIAT